IRFDARGQAWLVGAMGIWREQGERFVAVGRVANAGRQLAVVTGEVLAYAAGAAEPKVVAMMQATMVYVQPRGG
ncbi:MAG TPA: hypothetical protein DIC45_08930, partial [Comamonadaceae bacterium]|nr:hypothetical protein [Comamonadaceae bacterium]